MIGIIGAMEEEILEIKKLMNKVETISICKLNFYKGFIVNKEVVLVKSGIGKSFSAMSTTLLLSNFDIDFVINIGSAGGLKSSLKTLDTIISKNVAQADFDLTAFGYKRDFSEKRLSFKADEKLVNKVKSLNLENVVFGDIVSSDAFISKSSQVKALEENFEKALCADMEAGSIAMILDHFDKEFIVIRSISDVVVNSKDNAIEFKQFLKKASKQSASICKKLIENIN